MVCKRRTKAVVIAEKLSEDIKGGKYDVGGKLPSMRALMKRFGVSKGTVGNAYCMLENAGYIQKIIGFGTVAAHQRIGA
ncbi:MAG: winged helix-turn-helix transcriptional regulator [Kiritimatiellae bacterium]|nr:winged helix-turn-helix transcriptional regulator [Kiritimatiellia bacterium]